MPVSLAPCSDQAGHQHHPSAADHFHLGSDLEAHRQRVYRCEIEFPERDESCSQTEKQYQPPPVHDAGCRRASLRVRPGRQAH